MLYLVLICTVPRLFRLQRFSKYTSTLLLVPPAIKKEKKKRCLMTWLTKIIPRPSYEQFLGTGTEKIVSL